MMGVLGNYASAESGILSLEEIAVGLSREGRFANQTILRWTVADHLLAATHYVDELWYPPLTLLHVALHDAHEAMTRDVPTCFKTPDLRALQRALDERLYAALGVPLPDAVEASRVKSVDAEMLLAEAALVAPPATYAKIIAEHGGRTAMFFARKSVGWVLQQQWSEAETAAEWLRQVRALLTEVKYGV